MPERPVIFSGPMVRALLDGRKTQTRRVLKLPTKGEYVRSDMGGWEATTVGGGGAKFGDGSPAPERVAVWNQTTGTCVVPPYASGDLLWVRETLRAASNDQGERWITYAADDALPHGGLWRWDWKSPT